jgi:NADH:ubiquinone oxidoreductase subunit
MHYITSNANHSNLRFSFVIYQSTACSGSYPKMYYISSNADRSDLRCSFVIYQSTACISGVYPKCIMYHPTPIAATHPFHLLYHSTACSGLYPKCIIYHPTPVGATCAFHLLYHSTACISGLYRKIYYTSSNADRSDSRFLFVIYQSTACISGECIQNVLCIMQR